MQWGSRCIDLCSKCVQIRFRFTSNNKVLKVRYVKLNMMMDLCDRYQILFSKGCKWSSASTFDFRIDKRSCSLKTFLLNLPFQFLLLDLQLGSNCVTVLLLSNQVLQHEEVPERCNPEGSIIYLLGGFVAKHQPGFEACGTRCCHQTMDSWNQYEKLVAGELFIWWCLSPSVCHSIIKHGVSLIESRNAIAARTDKLVGAKAMAVTNLFQMPEECRDIILDCVSIYGWDGYWVSQGIINKFHVYLCFLMLICHGYNLPKKRKSFD